MTDDPLSAHGIVRRFGGLTAVDGVDLTVPAGRITALVGPNGAGKSTLFDCLAGAVRPDAGRVVLAGRDVTGLPDHARARLGLARTFQQLAVFPDLTVADNVLLGAEHGRTAHPGLHGTRLRLARLRAAAASRAVGHRLGGGPPHAAARDATRRALDLFGLAEQASWPADRLPPGALRLVELARAVAAAPTVLLLDEPAAGLDTAQTARLTTALRALATDGLALLVVEHDPDLIGRLADTVHVLTRGRVVAAGPAAGVLADPAVARLWGRE
ncbi:ABC transporter ATP-binding protein [Kitasatospora sp. NPDC049285]|uniref:ABC transporter ATP-binding protein n=1 Tax=Kitasatospora sp. NPDC049285 TaxID=3157096 RepID=UPI00342D8C45